MKCRSSPTIGRQLLADERRLRWDQLNSHSAIRQLISELIPGYEGLSDLDRTKEEFHVPGRAVDEYKFLTPSGRAKFHVSSIPKSSAGNGHLRLMTIRSEGQFNSVVYDEEDYYRGQERRDVVLMNADDIGRLGLKVDQRVKLRSNAGEMRAILVRAFDIRAGNVAMYYPEANDLVPGDVDPLSKTPGFKSVIVTIEPEGGL